MLTEEMRTQAVELYLKGWTQTRIAQSLGCPQSRVSEAVSLALREWRAEMQRERIELVGEALAKVKLAQSYFWMAGDTKSLLKAIDMECRIVGAYRPDVVVVGNSTLPWEAMCRAAEGDAHAELEQKLAELEQKELTNGTC